ncbi:MAG TPA: molybdopterin-dependent oxidoreductase [Candidatus Limnocylindrales bacterium]|nr:molybdopterin-dependent oxidoreductase [Candidatus Limnocylindrales bacterium]
MKQTKFKFISLYGSCFIICLIIFLYPIIAVGQTPEPNSPVANSLLMVVGEVEHPLRLEESDLAKLPRRTVQVRDHEGKEATYEGVPLVDILQLAGVKFGRELRGKQLARYLLVQAADGYQVVFALPELDPSFTDRLVLLADRRDGRPLSAPEGPLHIVIPDEKRHARWVRQVTTLRILPAGRE